MKSDSQRTLDEALRPWHLLGHPFYQDWMQGRLSREDLRDYAGQYFAHVEAFPRYLSSAHSLCTDPSQRRVLLENLNDEEGVTHGTPHPVLWLRFAEGLGLSRAEVQATALRAGIQNVIDTFFRLSRASAAQALGALYAYESQVPEIAASKIQGLKERYGIDDPSTLSFFEVHREADVWHREVLRAQLDSLTEEQKRQAQEAAVEAATALWNFLSDVHMKKRSPHVSCIAH